MSWTRRIVIVVALLAVLGTALWIWRDHHVTPATIKAWLGGLGPAAPLLFVVAFMLGASVGLPGSMMIVGGRLAFGPELGFVVGYAGAVLGTSLPFATGRLLRRASGRPWRPKSRFLARAFAMLETRPVLAVAGLRLVMWMNTPLSYALALTPIRFRDHLLGCVIGLAPVAAFLVLASGWFV